MKGLYGKNGRERRGCLAGDNTHTNDVSSRVPALFILRIRVRLVPEPKEIAFSQLGPSG